MLVYADRAMATAATNDRTLLDALSLHTYVALMVFEKMLRKSVVSWTLLVSALSQAGHRHDTHRCSV